MAVVRARTLTEAYMYLELVIEGDRPIDHARLVRLSTRDGERVVRVDGPHGGRHYQLTIVVAAPPPGEQIRGIGHFGHGPEPSTLIDPGGWRMIELWSGPVAEAALREGAAPRPDGATVVSEDPDRYTRAGDGLLTALAALDEIARFIPPGAAVVPPEAFFTPSGREVLRREPEAFHRARIEHERVRYRALLDQLVARHSPSTES